MTEIEIGTRKGLIQSIMMKGHAGFAEKGGDIVCAGLSTVIQSLEIGLSEVLGRKDVTVKIGPEEGFMSVTLENPAEEGAGILMETAARSLKAIAESYPSHVYISEVEQNETV